ncbi:MAG: DEAD/DEAH box helicase [Roseiflexaceae bacterium]|nr:DEAD/DEAH box helicase [Roseiflexus sp.]MDW8213307.1 DEAD/DEAH box helicase [Roseiflexaceae bacterium]
MTEDSSIRAGIQDVADALRTRLQRYIEAAYYLRDASVVAERRALLTETGAIAREPFLETTPSYEVGESYGALGLPQPISAVFEELAGWQPGIGIFPRPYRHQAEALRAFFNARRDLIVSTGTGSGKTEIFLWSILGSLISEASNRPESYQLPGCRALLLYPMNALVSDQIARLRRMFGDERLSAWFRARYGRQVRFGMYTSRTPYPGPRDAGKDREYVERLIRYYLDLEDAAHRDGPESESARLVADLRMRGRWPAKDLRSFAGAAGGRWDKRLLTQPGDCELLTRHEMQQTCPDILITNYSMLEYMLMRPIERNIFAQTQRWLASHPDNCLILVLDEAHLYRGTAGAEVGYLIRRLQARLDLPRERLRCILTSASLGPEQTIEADAVAFAEALTGSPKTGGRSFQVVRGYREPRPPARPGSPAEAGALATFDQERFAWRAADPAQATAAVAALGQALGWPPLADADGAALQRYLYDRLYGFDPVEMLIAESAGRAISLENLAARLFPDSEPPVARRATEALLALGVYAHNGQRPLLQTRLHLLLRGLPSLWACVNPRCSERLSTTKEPTLLGRLYTEPRTHCACGARVYELVAHRSCGAVFLRVFGTDARATFYWHEAGGRINHEMQPLHEDWLIVERPLRKHESDGLVEPIWMDMRTGRVTTDPPPDLENYRQFWRPTTKARRGAGDDDNPSDSQAYPFECCPACNQKTPDKVSDLATRGERPFANIIYEQFLTQPPDKPFSERFPNGGRKVLLFADGRQKAARLARDLPREVEFDVFRQALALAVHRLKTLNVEPVISDMLYAAFVAVCYELRLHFFDRESDSQEQLLRHMRDFKRFYDADLEQVLNERESPFGDPPRLYRQHLLDQVANPFYNLYSLGVMVVRPSRSTLRKIQREIERLPEQLRDNIETIVTFWIRELLERGAFDKDLPRHVRRRVLAFDRAPNYGKPFRDFEKVVSEEFRIDNERLKQLRKTLYDTLTEQGEDGLVYLRPSALALTLAVDDAWHRCATCGNLQHAPFLGRCIACGERQLELRPPNDPTIAARLDYYRQPIRDVLCGKRPAHITAEEHTAQLTHRDAGSVYATAEEFELRFQDIALGEEKPPVDVLSCTTTMEVGIDIGSLVAIGMRNVPPQRENYQQRAGRAGRRGTALSTVVTFAQNGSHDQFYYYHPEEIIAGDPRRPFLGIDRPALARRHIHAYLIQTFFHESIDRLAPAEREQLERERQTLFTALGTCSEFFESAGPLSFTAFQKWLTTHGTSPGSNLVLRIAAWFPDQVGGERIEDKAEFVRAVARKFIEHLEQLRSSLALSDQKGPGVGGVKRLGNQNLLDALFDAGLLPTYAFPTDVVAFYVFERDGERVKIKEQPQRDKVLALSEYAPGRLLVVNKETYRVGGIYAPGSDDHAPVRKLFEQLLPRYVYCPACTYVRHESLPPQGIVRCPVCQATLQSRPLLDPPGFAPEGGRPVGERDNEQEISYATEAQLPLPAAPEHLEWRTGRWPHLHYAYAENQQFIVVNRGPDDQGFRVCERCGATWPAGSAPEGAHERPYPVPGHQRRECSGPLHETPIYLGTTFRSDLLILRCTLADPLDTDPRAPWLHDALRTAAEALALAASRALDTDPVELSAGYRFLPNRSKLGHIDLYLFDTAAGGAGYAAEAGVELEKILHTALDLVEGCPRECERSCTRCLRHYGNRFWHYALDRHLAAHFLRYVVKGELPLTPTVAEQRQLLKPLRRFFELEGWECTAEHDDIPLFVRGNGRAVAIGVYPALLNAASPAFSHPLQKRSVLLRDYIVTRDLPLAYAKVSASL